MGPIFSSEGFKPGNGKQYEQRGPGGSHHNPHHDQQHKYSIELLSKLEEEFECILVKIRSMRTGKVDSSVQEQLFTITGDTEIRLHEFNKQYFRQRPGPQSSPTSRESSDEKNIVESLTTENNKLRKLNELLEAEKKRGWLTNSMTSRSPIPPEEKYQHQPRPKSSASVGEGGNSVLAAKVNQLQWNLRERDEENAKLQGVVNSLYSFKETLEKENEAMKRTIRKLETDNDSLLTRLSKVAGQKLTENNPAIADLSDPNRPTKLGEMYSEIYDNEWTNAFEELNKAGYSEEECIETLRMTLLNVVQFCQRKSETLLEKTEEAVNILFKEYTVAQEEVCPSHLTMPRKDARKWGPIMRQFSRGEDMEYILLQQKWKPKIKSTEISTKDNKQGTIREASSRSAETMKNQLKIFRKEVAESMVPLVQKAYITASWREGECVQALMPYIRKCLFLGWMMVVQSPPLVLASCQEGDVFVKDIYKEYTKSGPKVQYVVWPAMLLHADGPVIGKGVAQGQK